MALPAEVVGQKACRTCGETKPLEDFHLLRRARDGRQSRCKTCACAYSREWHQRTRVVRHAKARTYAERGREGARRRYRAWMERHREEHYAETAAYKRANKERVREWSHQRRVRLREGVVENIDHGAIYERDEGICHLCDQPVDRQEFTLDHVIPVSLGGAHSAENVRVAHGSCNYSRNIRSVEEARARLVRRG